MTEKSRNITGWILTGLISIVFIASAVMKLKGGEEIVKATAAMGMSLGVFKMLGVIELLSLILFIIPRTGLLGTLLLTAYLGGAIATHLEHQQSVLTPVIIESVLWITATIRFPELSRRLLGYKSV